VVTVMRGQSDKVTLVTGAPVSSDMVTAVTGLERSGDTVTVVTSTETPGDIVTVATGPTAGAPRRPSAGRRLTAEQRKALEQLRPMAEPFGLRVVTDAEGFPMIPGKLGQIEWCDPAGRQLAVYSNRPRAFQRIWAIPGVRKHQTGDTEMRALLESRALAEVGRVIRARRRRSQTSPGSLRNLRPRAASAA
jgi:hypothetical protein